MLRKFSFILVTVFLIALWACSPSAPEMPQWDITLANIPLIGPDTIVIGEEISDENMITDSDSLYHIEFTGSEMIDVKDQMKQDPVTPNPFEGAIGNFEVSGNTGEGVDINIFDAFPALLPFDGLSAPVPASAMPVIEKDLTMSNFSSVSFVEGAITVKITNNLPWDLGTPVNIELKDQISGATIDQVTFSSEILKNGGSSEGSFDLTGKTLSNSLKVIVTGNENGTGASPVTINGAAQGFTVDVIMDGLKASSATANIPEQEFGIMDSVNIGTDEVTVISAKVETGQINLNFSSDFDFPVRLNVTLPQIMDAADTVKETITIQPNSSGSRSIDLQNADMNLNGGVLKFDIVTEVLTGGSSYTVNATDKITVSVSTSAIIFSTVRGDLDVAVDFPTFQEELVDLDFEVPDINFTAISFKLNFVNNPAEMDVSLDLVGTKEGTTETASYTFHVPENSAGSTEVVLSNTGVTVGGVSSGSGGGIADLINMLPEMIEFSGTAQIDDDDVILDGSPIEIAYTVDVPFEFSMPSGAVLEGDVDEFDIEDDTRDRIREDLGGSEIEIVLSNGLALGGALSIKTATLAQYNDDMTGASWGELISLGFSAAPTDVNGDVILPIVDQDVNIGLTKTQLATLADAEYIYWEVVLDAVALGKMKSTDTIILRKGFLTGTLRISKDLFDKDDTGGSP